MPMPLPAYVPREIADEIAAGGFAGLKDFALSKGMSATRLNKLFSTANHPRLMTWVKIARYTGITLDELYKIAKGGKLDRLIDRLQWERGLNLARLEAEIGLGRDVLRARVSGYESIEQLEKYADTARRLNWTLEELAAAMLREPNRKAVG